MRLAPAPHNDPYLDEGMRGHIVRMARKHCYKVAGHDVEDLIQEGYICYYHCRARYVGKPPSLRPNGKKRRFLPPKHPDNKAKRHFMALVQRSFANRISTLASRQSALVEIDASSLAQPEQEYDAVFESIMPPEDEVASVTLLLAAAPKEILELLAILANDAFEGYQRFGNRRGRRARQRETTEEYINRRVGPDLVRRLNYDVSGSLERYFQSA